MTEAARCRDGRCARMSATGLCLPCADRLGGWLADLPELYVRLTLATARAGGTAQLVSGTPEPPVPVRVDILDHLALIADHLASWAALAAEERNLAGPAERPPFRWLTAHAPWMAGRPWADDYAAEVHDLRRVAAGLLGDTVRRIRIGKCITVLDQGTCGEALYAAAGDTVIRCHACDADWTREYWLLLGSAIEEMSA